MRRRAAGLLLHPTSLPRHEDGIAAAAEIFFAWARDAGVSVWQILPVGPPGEGRSPYAAPSAFAGDPTWFESAASPDASAVARFAEEHAAWLDDWSLYAALKEANRGRPWLRWDEALRRRDPAALARSRATL